MKKYILLILIFSLFFAGTHNYVGNSGDFRFTTQITVNPVASYNGNTIPTGSQVQINFGLNDYYFSNSYSPYGITLLTVDSYDALKTGNLHYLSYNDDRINLNFMSSIQTYIGYYNAGSSHFLSGSIRCVDLPGSKSCPYNPALNLLNGLSQKNYHYGDYKATAQCCGSKWFNKKSIYTAGVCEGYWYVNNNYVGRYGQVSSYILTIPQNWNQTTYPVNVELRYRCLFIGQESYNPSYFNEIQALYYNPSLLSDSYSLNVNVCFTPTLALQSPNLITIGPNSQEQVTLTLTNNGAVDLILDNIQVDNGFTFTPSNPLPTLTPGQTVQIQGTLTSPATIPNSITFTANAHTNDPNACVQNTAATSVSNLHCPTLSYQIISHTDPIDLTNGPAGVNITILNNGDVAFDVDSLSVSPNNFALSNIQLPINVQPGNTATINSTLSIIQFPAPNIVQFDVNAITNANVCGANTLTQSVVSQTINPPCRNVGIAIQNVIPNPIVIAPNQQIPIILVIQNTGAVQETLTSIQVDNGFIFTPSNPLPTLTPGQTVQIQGTLTSPATIPNSITFTANAHTNEQNTCQNQQDANDTFTVPTHCPILSYQIISHTDPIDLTNGPAGVNITILNNGDVAFNITSFSISPNNFVLSNIQLPMNVLPTQTALINATVNIVIFPAPNVSTLTSTATTSIPVCGNNTLTQSVVSQMENPPCKTVSINITSVSPSPILMTPNSQKTVIINITNDGMVQETLTSIQVDNGFTFTPSNPLPTLTPGQTVQIQGTLTSPATIPNSITFTANAHTNEQNTCQNQQDANDTFTVPTHCPILSAQWVDITNPINLTSGKGSVTLVIRNNGEVNFTIDQVTTDHGSFVPNQNLPVLVPVNGTVTIDGVFSHTHPAPSTVQFNVSYSAQEPVCEDASGVLTNTSNINENCTYIGLTIDSVTDPINLVGMQGSATLVVRNTGQVPINLTSISVNNNYTFETNDIPYNNNLQPGDTYSIQGVLSHPFIPGSNMPSVTFTVNATTSQYTCDSGETFDNITADVIKSCGILGITILEAVPQPVHFQNGEAYISLLVNNSKTVPLIITDITLDNENVTFEPQGGYPIPLAPNQTIDIDGWLRERGVMNATKLVLTVHANATGETCDLINYTNNSTNLTVYQKGDLVPTIIGNVPRGDYINNTQAFRFNVTVSNIGVGNISQSTTLNILVYLCDHPFVSHDCLLNYSTTFSVDPLDSGENETFTIDRDFYANGYHNIIVIANVSDNAEEETYTNNQDRYTINAFQYRCVLNGPEKLDHLGSYTFNIDCYDGNTPVNCEDIATFTYQGIPSSSPTSGITYSIDPFPYPAYQNATLNVYSITRKLFFTLTAVGSINSHPGSTFECSLTIPAEPDKCIWFI